MDAPVVAARVLLRGLSLCMLVCMLGAAAFYLLALLGEEVSQHRRQMNARAYHAQLYFDHREALLDYLAASVVHAPTPRSDSAMQAAREDGIHRLSLGEDAAGKPLQLLLPVRTQRTMEALGIRLFHVGPGTGAGGRWLAPPSSVETTPLSASDAALLDTRITHDAAQPHVHWRASRQGPGTIYLYRAMEAAPGSPHHWLAMALAPASTAAALDCEAADNCVLLDAAGQPAFPTEQRPNLPELWLRRQRGDAFGLAWMHGLPQGLTLLKSIGQDDWRMVQHVGPGQLLRGILTPLLVTATLCLAAAVLLRALTLKAERQLIGPAREQHQLLLESFNFASTVVETAPVGICVLRCRDGAIMLENQLARDWLGCNHHSDDWNAAWRNIAQNRDAQATATRQARDFTTHDGRELQVLYAATRYRNEDVLLCVFNDISRHRQIQTALASAKQAADNASKAKSAFVATMSHEIRTPLHGLLGTLELLTRTQLDPRQTRLLQTMQQSSAVLLQLISNVLDVSRIESGQLSIRPAPFCPLDLSEATLRAYADAALRKQLQILVCTDATLPVRVLGDADRIRQILGNLLSNAIKFTDGGRVFMRVWPESDPSGTPFVCWQITDTGIGIDAQAQQRLFQPFQQAQDQHRAEGSGLGLSISKHLVEQMQGQLQLVSAPGLGSSFTVKLPLPTVEEESDDGPALLPSPPVYVRCPVAELTDSACQWLRRWGATARPWAGQAREIEPGAILVDSDPSGRAALIWSGPRVLTAADGGDLPLTPSDRPNERIASLFSIRAIALAVAQLQHNQSTPIAFTPSIAQTLLRLNVLVVEDNPINALLLKEQLQTLGCSVTLADDGQQALAHCSTHHFDAILTDINMPRIDGHALARRLRAAGVPTPIIGTTANAAPEIRQLCRDSGMDDCLFKPITLSMLQAQLAPLEAMIPVASEISPIDAQAPADELRVPASVLPIFLDTMDRDIQQLRLALATIERRTGVQLLHRIRGALMVVAARQLADTAHAVEQKIMDDTAWPDVVTASNAFLTQLEHALLPLKAMATHTTPASDDAHARQDCDR